MSAPVALPNYGIDADRILGSVPAATVVRSHLSGRFAIDEFGGDPQLSDLVLGLAAPLRVEIECGENIPRRGPALCVVNRGVGAGVVEPLALSVAVRRSAKRRVRVVGAPEWPVLGPVLRRLGAVGYRSDDVAALLRAGYLVGAPLGPTWLRAGAGEPPRRLLAATLGFPVIPVAVVPGGPAGLPIRPWRVVVGDPLLPPAGTAPDDQLAAAELAEEVRAAVRALIDGARR